MPPTILAAIISLLQFAITFFPGFIAQLKAIFAKDNITAADFEALRGNVALETYEKFVPDTALDTEPPLAIPGGTGPGASIDALAEVTAQNVAAAVAPAAPVKAIQVPVTPMPPE